jgi:hypothetical protein
MNGNYSTSPEEESATGRPDRDPLATQDDPAKFLTQDTGGEVEDPVPTPIGGRCMPAARRSTAQLRVEPCGLSREVVAFGEAGR